MPYVVGLTGGIGSGKTEVARAFESIGVEIADADAAAHAVTAMGERGHEAVVAMFGDQARAADGSLDRAWLRQTVFGDPEARKRLEATLHPLILAQLELEMARWRGPYGILAVPLLLERGNVLSRVSRVLVVDCPEDLQVTRVMARSGLAAADVRAIMATQLSRAERLSRADDVVDNSGPREAIVPQVARLDVLYRRLALEPPARSRDNGAQGPSS
jgi:dephospho-CoA kinase